MSFFTELDEITTLSTRKALRPFMRFWRCGSFRMRQARVLKTDLLFYYIAGGHEKFNSFLFFCGNDKKMANPFSIISVKAIVGNICVPKFWLWDGRKREPSSHFVINVGFLACLQIVEEQGRRAQEANSSRTTKDELWRQNGKCNGRHNGGKKEEKEEKRETGSIISPKIVPLNSTETNILNRGGFTLTLRPSCHKNLASRQKILITKVRSTSVSENDCTEITRRSRKRTNKW